MNKSSQKISYLLLGLILGLIIAYASNLSFKDDTHPTKPNLLTNEQIDELGPKKNEDISGSSLQTKNKKLKQIIVQLQNTIKELEQNKGLKVNSTLIENDKPAKHKPTIKFLSTAFIKKNIPKKEYIISPKLKDLLELTPEQNEQLAQLLVEKATTSVDLMEPLFVELASGSVEQLINYNTTGKILNSTIEQQIDEQLDDKQYYFEQNLREILSEEQITNYTEFEKEKATKQFARIMNSKSRNLMRLPKIETYQKDNIKQFFAEAQPDLSKVKIAAFKSPILRNTKVIPQDFDEKLKAHLKGLLTDEQFKAYEAGLGF